MNDNAPRYPSDDLPYDDDMAEEGLIQPPMDEDLAGYDDPDEDSDPIGIDDDIYDTPPPPLSDDELVQEPPDGGGWFKSNWWKLALIIVLVIIVLALLARACGGGKEKATPTAVPSPTAAMLPTFTPTPGADLLPTEELGTGEQPPAGGEGTPEAPSQPAATSQPSGGKLGIGQTVVVTDTGKNKLSFRAGPGTTYEIIRLIKDGTQLTIIGGPKDADGYTWWQMKTNDGLVGWAVEDYLEPVKE